MPKAKLTPKQERFVQEYLVDLNATQAAIRAGYSKKTAKEQASRLLTNVNVELALANHQRRTADKLELSREDVLREYMALGFSDVGNYMQWDDGGTTVYASDDLKPEHRRAVEMVKFTRDTRTNSDGDELKTTEKFEFKLHSKVNALDKLGQHLGLFKGDGDNADKEGFGVHFHFGADDEVKQKVTSNLKLHLTG